MKKKRLFLCGILFFLLAVCACRGENNEKKEELPEIVIGGSLYAPYFYRDVSGSYAGIDAELASEACRRIGYEPVFKKVDLSERNKLLREGTIDCIWCCFTMDGREDDCTSGGINF